MTIAMWLLSSVSTVGIIAVVGFLCRNFIAQWFAQALQHDYDKKLEEIKADLREKESEIAALRDGPLSGLTNRQIALDKRRIEAVEQIWSGVTILERLKWYSDIMARINLDKAIKATKDDPKAQAMWDVLFQNMDVKDIKRPAKQARPFVTNIVWALYCAYEAILFHAVAQAALLKTGVGENLTQNESTDKILLAALPQYEDYIKKFGPSGYHFLLDTIEMQLMDELKKMLEGTESDRAGVERAAAILQQVGKVHSEGLPDVEIPENLRTEPVEAPAVGR